MIKLLMFKLLVKLQLDQWSWKMKMDLEEESIWYRKCPENIRAASEAKAELTEIMDKVLSSLRVFILDAQDKSLGIW